MDGKTIACLSRLARALVICPRNGDLDFAAAAEHAAAISDEATRLHVLGRLAEIEAIVEDLVSLAHPRIAPAVATGHGARADRCVPRFARDLLGAAAVAVPAPVLAPETQPAAKPRKSRKG